MVHCLLVLGIICADIQAGIPILQALEKSQDVLLETHVIVVLNKASMQARDLFFFDHECKAGTKPLELSIPSAIRVMEAQRTNLFH